MDIRLLRALVRAADHPTFSEAATSLSITQPAFTKQIQQLESQVGTALFRRGRHGAGLTSAGAALLNDARTIVDLADRFGARVRRLSAGDEGHLTVGFGLSSIAVAPRVVAAFRSTSPGVTVRLEDMSSAAQIEGVRSGELDIAFARMPAPPDLRAIAVLSDRLVIAHPDDGDPPPEGGLAEWLHRHPLVRLSTGRGPGLAAQVGRYLSTAGVTPQVVQEADDLQTVLALVAAGVGAAIVPESARNIGPARVSMRRLGGASASWTVGVVWRADNETPVVRAFLDELARIPEG
ncbi:MULTISPECIES: LysR family transcriptional regulator [unclassified Microbacterium]|uniref:LysR family transcriptional regulator n=1 Tax=unclassified Microbacterium TaxID=2609290 RepID=UPI000EA87DB2|nr:MULTISPECIES: LysR family transcriptional regulator [unclassified Microbacterium]MBT2486906.1 LysR family transcriptional regulator [Microbacterium sp. ISL-108]RKN64821.1 LysR family transcriptional regulator [Microbacterium sp. CGR2]